MGPGQWTDPPNDQLGLMRKPDHASSRGLRLHSNNVGVFGIAGREDVKDAIKPGGMSADGCIVVGKVCGKFSGWGIMGAISVKSCR